MYRDSIISIVENSNDLVKESFEAVKVKLEKSMQEVIGKNRAQVIKIKDICTKYFEKNDDSMKIMQEKVKIVDTTFNEFLNTVTRNYFNPYLKSFLKSLNFSYKINSNNKLCLKYLKYLLSKINLIKADVVKLEFGEGYKF